MSLPVPRCGSRTLPLTTSRLCMRPGAVRGLFMISLSKGTGPTVKEETLPKKLLSLKKQTSWSWERMCREFHRVMAHEGPSDTTLFRYAKGKGKRPNVAIERYVREAIRKITVELSQKEDSPKQNRLR